jgi:hypothetical protein
VLWRRTYANTGAAKSGQTQPGSGTTPTLMGERYVAITDNDDPINVVVARRGDGRVVCTEPLFEKGASSTDQSLIATNSLIVAENNFGYSSPTATENGHTTSLGLQRVDVEDGRCRTVWRSRESAPSAVAKLSLAAGLVYTYTKPARDDGQDAWYLTALDVRTGKTAFQRLAGEGLEFNNNYAPITWGPTARPTSACWAASSRGATALGRSRRCCAGPAASAPTRCCAMGACCASRGAAAGNRSTSDRDRPDFAKNGPMSGYRIRPMGIQGIPMSEPNVSDLVFRDLDPDTPPGRAFDDAWEAALREELEKLRPVRPGPRVIPAADAGDRPPRRGR